MPASIQLMVVQNYSGGGSSLDVTFIEDKLIFGIGGWKQNESEEENDFWKEGKEPHHTL